MKYLSLPIWAVLLGILLASMLPVQAIPGFARKYGFNCTMCHTNFPRLNDFGLRFRMNGYRLPGKEADERTADTVVPTISLRTSVGYTRDQFTNTADTPVNQFQVNGLDLLSAGLLSDKVGYFLAYTPEIAGSRGVEAQTGSLEAANIIYAPQPVEGVRVRVGRFEPAYVAFSDKRRLTVSPYEIYAYTFPGTSGTDGLIFAETQEGVEVTEYRYSDYQLAAGWINGSATNTADDSPADFYLRGAKVFGRGEGQVAGQRLGLTAYMGQARPMGAPAISRQSFNRLAADASLNYRLLHASLQYMHASDSAALWPGATERVRYSGGFAEVLYPQTERLLGIARYGWVQTPGVAPTGNIHRTTLAGRYYLADHLAFLLEYSRRTAAATATAPGTSETLTTGRFDFAF